MKHKIFDIANYVIIDAVASNYDVIVKLREMTKVVCLTDFSDESAFYDVIPYLVELNSDSTELFELLESGFGEEWGIYIKSDLIFDELCSKLGEMIDVIDDNGEELIFRYYDPIILINFFKVITNEQAKEMFEGIEHFIAEDIEKSVFYLFNYDEKINQTEIFSFK